MRKNNLLERKTTSSQQYQSLRNLRHHIGCFDIRVVAMALNLELPEPFGRRTPGHGKYHQYTCAQTRTSYRRIIIVWVGRDF